MIVGIGSDIVQIDRIAAMVERHGQRFIERCFSVEEITQSSRYGDENTQGLTAYYAKRFAAKEAFVKAVGTGMRQGINFCDISVINDALGKPEIQLTESAQNWLLEQVSDVDIWVSLSDDYPVAHAMVVLSKR